MNRNLAIGLNVITSPLWIPTIIVAVCVWIIKESFLYVWEWMEDV